MKYIYFFIKSFKSQFAYRKSVLLKFMGAGLELFVMINLWTALLQTGTKTGITLQDMLFFVVVNMLVAEMSHVNIAVELEPQIRNGSVLMHFIKPMSFKYYCLSSVFGKNAFFFLTAALPAALITTMFIDFPALGSLTTILSFVASAILGMFIVLELSYIVGLLAFYTQRTWYLNWYLSAGKIIFGGTIVPIWFYPNWLDSISYYLPFRYIAFEPINIALGKSTFTHSLMLISIAMAWVVLLALLGQYVYNSVEKRLTINGG